VSITLYVEGGAKGALATQCRKGFSLFLKRAGFEGNMPRVVACGGRSSAYNDFCTAKKEGKKAILLVDSEAPVADSASRAKPWDHVKNRVGDEWEKPSGATDDDLHFMVQCMEAWLIADKKNLSVYFGRGFNESALPKNQDIEKVGKQDLYKGLSLATKNTQKGEYRKGKHSFEILGELCPNKVRLASPYADRFLNNLLAMM